MGLEHGEQRVSRQKQKPGYLSPFLQVLLPLPVPESEISLAAVRNLHFAPVSQIFGEHGNRSRDRNIPGISLATCPQRLPSEEVLKCCFPFLGRSLKPEQLQHLLGD